MLPRKTQAFACIALIFLGAGAARAQLGQSVQRPDRQLQLQRLQKSETRTADKYRYMQLSSDDLVVKQFVNPTTNSVFGVTWKGRRMPSLMSLLGFDPYTISGPGVTRSLHATHIQTDMLSVEIIAVMGRYQGRAVRADLVPQGVSASVVTP